MSLINLFEQIESVRFSIQVDIASSFRIFQRALEENETTQMLIRYLQEHPEYIDNVFQRLLDLLDKNDKPEYAHPYDEALAGYLYVLRMVDPQVALRAANYLTQTPKLWWAKKLADLVIERTNPVFRVSYSSPDTQDTIASYRLKAIQLHSRNEATSSEAETISITPQEQWKLKQYYRSFRFEAPRTRSERVQV